MADIFKRRETAEEAKFKLDAERRFKAEARRNKLLGLWAAESMGLFEADADAYAKTIVAADFKHAGPDDVIAKLVHDFAAKGVTVGEAEIRREIVRLQRVADEQVGKEFPKALDSDHERVGD